MDFIANTIKMYEAGDKHVEVLVASVRSMEHFLKSIELGADIITAPLKILKQWASASFPLPLGEGQGEGSKLAPIPYQQISLTKPWQEYNIQHELTDKGIEKFAQDWNNLIIIP
jgi:transaldolase